MILILFKWTPLSKDFLGDFSPHSVLGMAIAALENETAIASSVCSLSSLSLPRRPECHPSLALPERWGRKSSLVDELLRRLSTFPKKNWCFSDRSDQKRTGGALLGDRIRMNTLGRPEFLKILSFSRFAH